MTDDEAVPAPAIDYVDKSPAEGFENEPTHTACYRYFDTDDWDVVLATLAGFAAEPGATSIEEHVRIGLRERTHRLSQLTENGVVLAADEQPPVEFEEIS